MIDDPTPASLCATLGIERAVLGAPMAKISGGALAAAVTAGGGLGFVGGGYGQPEWLAAEMGKADGARVGIGLITWNIGPEAVQTALAAEPAAIWLSFDDPRPLVGPIHDAGVLLVCQVASIEEAEQAAEAGAAVIVAQGGESGGHGRSEPTIAGLVPDVVAAVGSIPVVAAGGIADVEGYHRAIGLGAAGVALGTRLYATDEANDV
ncbi:MAG: nitronate monooxygenase, partial [Actinomycetota bacterium]